MLNKCFFTNTLVEGGWGWLPLVTNSIFDLVSIGGKTRITFFGLDETATKVISRFPSDGCK